MADPRGTCLLLVVTDIHDLFWMNIAFLILETLVVKAVVIPILLTAIICGCGHDPRPAAPPPPPVSQLGAPAAGQPSDPNNPAWLLAHAREMLLAGSGTHAQADYTRAVDLLLQQRRVTELGQHCSGSWSPW